MTFSELAQYFENLEKTASRNTMTEILAELFRKSSISDIGRICFLLQGRVAPLYEPLEFGMADKMVIKAIARGLGKEIKAITGIFKQTGDLGETVSSIKCHVSRLHLPEQGSGGQASIRNKKLDIGQVYQELYKLVTTIGLGSQDKKIKILGDLIRQVDSLSAKYIVRIVLAKLRMGFSDMTILDSLSWMLTGSKKAKKILEAAYNVRPDLGYIAYIAKKQGEKGLRQIKPVPGTPIRMAKADRLSSAEEIFKKIGRCAVEYKYDGLRLQVHYDKNKPLKTNTSPNSAQQKLIIEENISEHIRLFSRNLEDITRMFPDICKAVQKQIQATSVIFEGEIVAYNPKTGAFVPFQETMQRKRKYDIARKAMEIPVKLYAFELLYADDINYINQGYAIRKKKLKQILAPGKTIIYAQEKVAENEPDVDRMFAMSVKENFEGIIAKKMDGVYEAGMRGWNWIKYKKAMNKKIADTVDVLVMGMTRGEGKRASFGVGQFLTGVYDEKNNKFVTLTKIGTGLTDEQFRELKTRTKDLVVKDKPDNYDADKLLDPDYWLKPKLVVEISGDEITRTSVHTAGRVMMISKSGSAMTVKSPGYALRFPRLVRFRDDKNPRDITTLKEIKSMFDRQKK